MDALKQAIDGYLGSTFEHDLFDASFANLQDTSNKLRFNNFAYSMRELTRHFLKRLAPDDDVRNAPWFKLNDPKKPKEITRPQRIKYAIQGWLSDAYLKDTLNIDFDDISKNLRNSIDNLSKYTHVESESFYVDDATIFDTSMNVLEDTLRFFMAILECQSKVNKAVYDCVDEQMISSFYIETQQDIDILATHYEVLAYIVTSINERSRTSEMIDIDVEGEVRVRLQYGSDGDMRRDNGYETQIDLPFTSQLSVSYKNKQGDVHIVDADVQIDNASHYE